MVLTVTVPLLYNIYKTGFLDVIQVGTIVRRIQLVCATYDMLQTVLSVAIESIKSGGDMDVSDSPPADH